VTPLGFCVEIHQVCMNGEGQARGQDCIKRLLQLLHLKTQSPLQQSLVQEVMFDTTSRMILEMSKINSFLS
jgi:hypothetical protein